MSTEDKPERDKEYDWPEKTEKKNALKVFDVEICVCKKKNKTFYKNFVFKI